MSQHPRLPRPSDLPAPDHPGRPSSAPRPRASTPGAQKKPRRRVISAGLPAPPPPLPCPLDNSLRSSSSSSSSPAATPLRSPSPTSNRHALAPAVPLRPELPSAASGLQRPPWPAALPASGRAGGPVLSSGSVAGAIVLVRAEPTLSETPFRLHSPASLSVFSAIWSAG